MYRVIAAILLLALPSQATQAGRYEYLKALDKNLAAFPIETTVTTATAPPPIVRNLSRYIEDFTDDGLVTFYLGLGKDAELANATSLMSDAIQQINTKETLGFQDFQTTPKTVRFSNADSSISYLIEIGTERNEFQKAFSNAEIVMYSGHSRYGRGPAFQTYSNYFRMGSVFDVIEVEAQNPYFLNEPIRKTAEFPIQEVDIGGKSYKYQYVDEKDHTSLLPKNTYVKNIPGYDKDLRSTKFLNSRQIFFFKSCSNVHYFRKPIRSLYSDPDDKFVFGTKIDTYGSIGPHAVLITNIAKEETDSAKYISALNETRTCVVADCYTAY